jgi:hypothetical protein
MYSPSREMEAPLAKVSPRAESRFIQVNPSKKFKRRGVQVANGAGGNCGLHYKWVRDSRRREHALWAFAAVLGICGLEE